mmetsp:Transcript_74092/g.176483  ORF Transcript_74092/g.176483 Transcript_74092/m.176483 type:complete len:250 (+) Transcript_74092:1541-2290(+)
MNRHEQPGYRWQSSFLCPGYLPLAQPPLHTTECECHEWSDHRLRSMRARCCSDTLKPADVLNRPCLVYRHVHSNMRSLTARVAPEDAQDRHTSIIDQLHCDGRWRLPIRRLNIIHHVPQGIVNLSQVVHWEASSLGTSLVMLSEADNVDVTARRLHPKSGTPNQHQPSKVVLQGSAACELHSSNQCLLRFSELLHVTIHGRQHLHEKRLTGICGSSERLHMLHTYASIVLLREYWVCVVIASGSDSSHC